MLILALLAGPAAALPEGPRVTQGQARISQVNPQTLQINQVSDRVVIMYLGRVVESGPTAELFAAPNHPYTQALLAEIGKVEPRKRVFVPIKGEIPSPLAPPSGCHFHPRCPYAMAKCKDVAPPLDEIAPGRRSDCYLNDVALQ